MATVYLARQADLDRLVALKELSAFRQSDPSFTHRFLRESRLAGSLSHPNIVTVYDYFEADEVPYIAMEYVARGSLRPHVGHMPLTQVAGVLEGILSALHHAEQRHIVHRDLKPENVMVTSEGTVKLTDFGIAKATGQAYSASFVTAAGTTVGTPNYMAPEQAMGKDIGPWTDLYSVGVMTFEMLVGQVPFHDTEEPMAVLMRQVSDPIPPARSLNPEVDQATSDWIERLLVKDPADRIQSAAEAWDQLEEIVLALAGPPPRRGAPPPPPPPPRAPATARRGRGANARVALDDRHRADPDGAPDALQDDQTPHHVRGPDASRRGARRGGTSRDRHAAQSGPARRWRRRAAAGSAQAAPRRAPEARAGGPRRARRAGGCLRGRARRGWRRCRRLPRARIWRIRPYDRRRSGSAPFLHRDRPGADGAGSPWMGASAPPPTGCPPAPLRRGHRRSPRQLGRPRHGVRRHEGQQGGEHHAPAGGVPRLHRTAGRHGSDAHRRAPADATASGLALPQRAAVRNRSRAEHLRRAGHGRRRDGGLRHVPRPGQRVRRPVRGRRGDAQARERASVPRRPQSDVRQRPECRDRRPPAGHRDPADEPRRGADPPWPGGSGRSAGQRLPDGGRPAGDAPAQPGRPGRQPPARHGAAARRRCLPAGRARRDGRRRRPVSDR